MSRIPTLVAFFARDLFRSLLGIIPPALTLALFQATFYFGGNVDYFAAVAGADLTLVALVSTLLLVSRANRAATYPLLARLPRRAELLLALFATGLVVTLAMGVLLVVLILGLHKATVTPLELVLILPRWVALFAFAIALGLNLGKLVSRGGSHALTACVLAVILTVNELQFSLLQNYTWLVRGVQAIASPLIVTMNAPAAAFPLVPWLGALAYGVDLFALAAALFERKDLLWAE